MRGERGRKRIMNFAMHRWYVFDCDYFCKDTPLELKGKWKYRKHSRRLELVDTQKQALDTYKMRP